MGWGKFKSWVKKTVKKVEQKTTQAVTWVGKKIENVATTIVNTASNILKDPKALAILAINVMAPGAGSAIGASLGLSGTMATFVGNTVLNTALNGGDVNAAAKSAALAIGGQAVANKVVSNLSDGAISAATKQIVGGTVSNATMAVIQGQDPVEAIKRGGVLAGVNLITSNIDGFKTLPVPAQNALKTTLSASLQGKDATTSIVYGAIADGLQAYKNVSDANVATKKELGRDLTEDEAKKFALYTSAGSLSGDIKNLVVGEKTAQTIESGNTSFTYDGKPVNVTSTDLNNYFKNKLTAAGLTPTADDINAASAVYGKSKDATSAINAIVDAKTVDAQEVKDIFAKEGITNLTPQQIEKYVKSNVDETTALSGIQKQADESYTTKQEVLDAFKGTGYTPTDADIAKFEGAKPEAVQTNAVKLYADPLTTDLGEAKDFLKSVLGREPTDSEASKFVAPKSEKEQKETINLFGDIVKAFEQEKNSPSSSTELAKLAEIISEPGVILRLPDGRVLIDTDKARDYGEGPTLPEIRIISKKSDTENLNIPTFEETQYDVLEAIQKQNPTVKADELVTDAFNAMQEKGYIPSVEDLINIITQTKDKTKASVTKAASDYGDQKVITKDEARQRLIDSGISKPTDAQINQFVKKGNQADVFKEIDTYANPLATTAAEAEQMLKDAGISKPTKEQIAMFTKEGLQADTQKALTTYANPFVTTAQEVKDMFAKIGYTNPTQEEIDRYTGEKPEAVQLDMAKTYGAAALATKQYIDPLNKRIEELVKQGSDYQTASEKAIAELTAQNKGLAETLGTGKKAVTQADIDLMTQMVSGKAAGDARYDVTGDKKVTQEDIDYLSKYLGTGTGAGTGAGTGTDTFKPGMGTYWAPTGLYGELYGNQLAQEAAAAKAAEERAAAEKAAAEKADAAQKAAAAKAAADKLAYQKSLNRQAYTNNIMMNMAASAPSGNVSAIAQPPSVVEASPVFDIGAPLDIGFFNQPQNPTQDQPGVVKIAEGGYMNYLFPPEEVSMDEILKILEGNQYGRILQRVYRGL